MSGSRRVRAAGTPVPKSIEIAPGLTVECFRATDGAWVVQLDGHPPGDEDCVRVRVYLNDGYAAAWAAPGSPFYSK